MNWNIIDQPATHEWIQALCLMLVHSLWQGLLAAILAGGILVSTRKSKPALRYNLLAFVMLLFVSSAVLTFILTIWDRGNVPASTIVFSKEWVSDAVLTNAGNGAIIAMEKDWIMQIIAFFSQHAQIIVTVWFVVFALKSLQAVSGLHYLNKITKAVSAPDMQWTVRFYELAERMQIGQETLLRESAQITVPMVIGFLKPVVLVPLGMLANLPAAQIEAILLHELAHIRRRDYLVNLLQIFCENVFFFNPAILWISKLIREEREHCCDDLAISVMQNKTSFIHALVSFQEYNQSRPVFEMAFSKKRNHLLDRIKRIVNNNNKPLDAMEKLFVTLSLAAAVALSAATAPEKPAKPKQVPTPQEQRQVSAVVSPNKQQEQAIVHPDTLPRKKVLMHETEIHSASVRSAREGISTYSVTRNNKHYEMVQRNGKIISLFIDDQEIAESDYSKYQPEIDKILADIKVQHERAEKEREKAEEMRKQADEHRREADKHREEAHALRLEAEKNREHASDLRVNANKNRDEAEKLRLEADKHRKSAEDMRKQADKMREEADQHRKEAEVHRAHAEKDREAYVKIQEGIINELSSAGLVKDKENLSYKLSNDELIVNGAKQSADLHQKLKAKYLKDLGDKKFELMYNYRNRNGHIKTGMVHSREE